MAWLFSFALPGDSDAGMLSDTAHAVALLQHVTFSFAQRQGPEGDISATLAGDRYAVNVELCVPETIFEALPRTLKVIFCVCCFGSHFSMVASSSPCPFPPFLLAPTFFTLCPPTPTNVPVCRRMGMSPCTLCCSRKESTRCRQFATGSENMSNKIASIWHSCRFSSSSA